MKVMTILGTRPEIIRLSRVIPLLDKHSQRHVLVHTGQNFDRALSDVFFEELEVRKPDYTLKTESDNVMEQVGKILTGTDQIMQRDRPDRVLILGDTNTGLAAYAAKRRGIPVYHMEAGNRCFDDRVPEEVNRRVIDSCSDVLMPYTERSRMNLLREGFESDKIFVTGNPINEVITHYAHNIDQNNVLQAMDLETGKYFLATLHRAENVDIAPRLQNFVKAFNMVYEKYKMPLVWSVHPRTRSKLGKDMPTNGVRLVPPQGLFEFIKLEKNAACVLTDSGTVQEECCIFKVPNVTLRDVTERPETIECGSNILSGADPNTILRCVDLAMTRERNWEPPREYLANEVSNTVAKIVLGYA